MKQLLKAWVTARTQYHERRELAAWERQGRPVPPPHVVKQRVLQEYAERYRLKIFIETGTYRGDMVEAMKPLFRKIYSIELGDELFQKAKRRFKRDAHIELIHGDSGTELGRIMPRLDEPALSRVAGHYSADDTARGAKDTPNYAEQDHILQAERLDHVIAIYHPLCRRNAPAWPFRP